MPSPAKHTVGTDLHQLITTAQQSLKVTTVENTISMPFGISTMPQEQLAENLKSFVAQVKAQRPSKSDEGFVESVVVVVPNGIAMTMPERPFK